MNQITHISSAHARYDIRIFVKMCSSAAKSGYNVNLIIADGQKNEIKNGVKIIDVGAKTGNRISRMTKTVLKVYKAAIKTKSDVYHLHDPELMTIGILLKLRGKKVVFDAHEDLPKQIKSKAYLNPISRIVLSGFFSFFEWTFCRFFDYVITATPAIRDKFKKINKNTIDINNYPLENELFTQDQITEKTKIVYTGIITPIRCAAEMIEAVNLIDNQILYMAGPIRDKTTELLINNDPKVDYLGTLSRNEMSALFSQALAGLVLYSPLPNHIESQPNKMFEYMSAGIPVIGSDFPLWREIIEAYDCGICVNPHDPKAIAEAIVYLRGNKTRASEMGENGRKAVIGVFNWSSQEKKLIEVYRAIVND